ncbi:hypothetical protein ACEUDG_16865 [Aeromonas rivipollensis]|uniref:hypothetical protein n=1 Tax=Aeromonas rivipollensis TaxID=948519 RepID=UPI0038D086F2
MAMTLQARLARLEALEKAVQFPTVIEMHDCIPVAADDRRRGTYVIEGSQVTFYAASAAEYEEASNSYANDRHIIVISIDGRCIDFKH